MKTQEIIEQNKDIYPDFLYYLKIIDKIESNLQKYPDISIEASKALLEWICKTIIINSSPWITREEKKRINNQDFSVTFKEAVKNLNRITNVEGTFVEAFKNMMNQLWYVRNGRWDISHWKATPKESSSDYDFAYLIRNVIDSICFYILGLYFNNTVEKSYGENEDFNTYLDENNEEIFSQPYSYALFTLDYDRYESELDIYNANIEENE